MRKFAILTMGRTGSYMLTSFLNNQPGVTCFGEMFKRNPLYDFDHLNLLDQLEPCFHELDYRQTHYRAYLDRFLSIPPENEMVGFKLIIAQHRGVLEHVINSDEYAIVLLYRENALASYSSKLVANATGQAVAKKGDPIKKATIQFERKDFERYWKRRQGFYDSARELLAVKGKDYLDIEYSRAMSKPGLEDLVIFLTGSNVDIRHAVGTEKRNPGAILDRFENRQEVENFLVEVDRLNWITEAIE